MGIACVSGAQAAPKAKAKSKAKAKARGDAAFGLARVGGG